jgi:hypothetical protein
MITKLLAILAFLFCCCSLHAQTNIVTIPPAPIISWCAHPANAVPCTNKVTTYTTATLATACPLSAQIVLDGTTSCVASPDYQNNWGVWIGPGAYDYTITIGTNNYGPFYVTEPCVSTGCTLTSPTITSPTISNPSITGGIIVSSTINASSATGLNCASGCTLQGGVINGTTTGTGIPTFALKKGTGSGNYTSASTTYVRADSTNLAYTVTVPTGWKLSIQASGSSNTNTGAVNYRIALADGIADNTGILAEIRGLSPLASATGIVPFSLSYMLTGDGASHTINLQYLTSNASDSVVIENSSATAAPMMVFILSPSN